MNKVFVVASFWAGFEPETFT